MTRSRRVAGSSLLELQCCHVATGSLIHKKNENPTGRDGYVFAQRFAPLMAACGVCSLGSRDVCCVETGLSQG